MSRRVARHPSLLVLALILTSAAPPTAHAQSTGDPPLPGITNVDAGLARKLADADARRRAGAGADGAEATPAFINRLALESSPYLLQHAHNPVNWYAWSDEAFDRARREHKPVLLSIGYSTCHWCHVMEHESFEDEGIARLLNEQFIAIKVDREERPDIDAVYMRAVQLLTGGGGWPMTLGLTPDRKPFFAATYIPAHDGDRGARKGFLSILRELAEAYATKPDAVADAASELSRRIAEESRTRPSADVPQADAIERAVSLFRSAFDPVNGGFGRAPKFPQPSVYELLLHYYRRTNDPQVLAMVTRSLDRMAAGGVYDHVGGGFHRYATDAQWLVPHFEKMLYDNAQLASVYLDAYQVTGRPAFAEVARETLDYLAREMMSPDGAFYAATDADSRSPSGEMKEGFYFTWTAAEIEQAVGNDDARLVSAYFGVTDTGNFDGRTILHTDRSIDDAASTLGLDPASARTRLATARAHLYDARLKRSPPFRDDKIVAAWNGLAISAFARGAFVLDRADDAGHARCAAEFVLSRMRAPDGTLFHSYRDGRASRGATLDDYAFMIQGLLDLYESVWEPRWLRVSIELQSLLDSRYLDRVAGAYFMTSQSGEELLARPKPGDDGAEPSGNSVTAMNLLRLAELTGDDAYRTRAATVFRAFATSLTTRAPSVTKLLSALDFHLDEPAEIVIVVGRGDTATRDALLARARTIYVPNRMFTVVDTATNGNPGRTSVPLAREKRALNGRTTAYVCRKRVCDLPTSDPELFARQLLTVEPLVDDSPEPPLTHDTPHAER